MKNVVCHLCRDEAGFVLSAELVLICTITVIAMMVGLTEVAISINQRLQDTASTFGTNNQVFRYSDLSGQNGSTTGSSFGNANGDFAGTQPIGQGFATN